MSSNIQINLSGTCITFSREEISIADSKFALLADIPSPISIHPGRFAVIPTPIRVSGDGATIALMEVLAGTVPDEDATSVGGRFLIPPIGEQIVVQAYVLNETDSTLMIHPKNNLGFMSFRMVRADERDDQEIRQSAGSVESTALSVSAVFAPKHIDSSLLPDYARAGASAFDLRADVPERTVLNPGGRMTVATGLSMAIPEGFEGQVRPRSGLASRHGVGLVNSPGTIDSDYRGEIMAVLHNGGAEPFEFEPGDRIAQFVVAPVVRISLDFDGPLDDTVRGSGAFGSTGR